jgi:hypothetical protein
MYTFVIVGHKTVDCTAREGCGAHGNIGSQAWKHSSVANQLQFANYKGLILQRICLKKKSLIKKKSFLAILKGLVNRLR